MRGEKNRKFKYRCKKQSPFTAIFANKAVIAFFFIVAIACGRYF